MALDRELERRDRDGDGARLARCELEGSRLRLRRPGGALRKFVLLELDGPVHRAWPDLDRARLWAPARMQEHRALRACLAFAQPYADRSVGRRTEELEAYARRLLRDQVDLARAAGCIYSVARST